MDKRFSSTDQQLAALLSLAALVAAGYFGAQIAASLVLGRDWLSTPELLSIITGQQTVPVAWWVVAAILPMLVVIGAVVLLVLKGFSTQEPDYREGLPTLSRVMQQAGAEQLRKRGKFLRPDLQQAELADLGWVFGSYRGKPVYMSCEEVMLVLGLPRIGKGTSLVVPALSEVRGGLITTSVRADNVKLVLQRRAELTGQTPWIFDPASLVPGIGQPVRWDPLIGCEDEKILQQRVAAITNNTFGGNVSNGEYWKTVSQTIIGALLHAAAVGRHEGGRWYDMSDVARWLRSPISATEAVTILQGSRFAIPGWAERLSAVIDKTGETRDNQWSAATNAAGFLRFQRVVEMLSPPRGTGFDPLRFLERQESLFLLGEQAGDEDMNKLAVMLLDECIRVGRERSSLQQNERLAPPCWIIIDEAANFVVPGLPELSTFLGGSGMSMMIVFQDIAQARKAYGNDAAAALIAAAGIKVIFPGLTEQQGLSDVASLIGKRTVRQRTVNINNGSRSESIRDEREFILEAADIAQLKRGYATVLHGNLPYLVRLIPYFQRPSGRDLAAQREASNDQVRAAKQQLLDARQERFGL